MTDLLKKEAFEWNDMATTSFIELKRSIIHAPVLAFSDFEKVFANCNRDGCLYVCQSGIGTVLM